jgi:hypothetical protein
MAPSHLYFSPDAGEFASDKKLEREVQKEHEAD